MKKMLWLLQCYRPHKVEHKNSNFLMCTKSLRSMRLEFCEKPVPLETDDECSHG